MFSPIDFFAAAAIVALLLWGLAGAATFAVCVASALMLGKRADRWVRRHGRVFSGASAVWFTLGGGATVAILVWSGLL